MQITTLLKQIEDGALVLPEFQRDFVWKLSDVKKFLNSIYHNYPSGTLLIWKTKKPPELRGDQRGTDDAYTSVLLDGQQRLTTLYSITMGEAPPYYGNKDLHFDLYFNIEEERFEYYQSLKMKDKKEWLSLRKFFSFPDAGNFVEECDDVNLKSYYLNKLSKLNKLSNIRHYEYYIDEDKLKSDMALTEVVKIFNLVNKEGRTLQESDLALAHVSVFLPGLKAKMREEIELLKAKNFEFSLDFMIQCVNAIGSRHAKFDYIYSLSKEEIEESWEKLKRSLEYLVNILHDRAYVNGTANTELKTDALLVPMIVYLSNNDFQFKSEELLRKFLYWFYNAMIWSRYTRRGKSAPLEQDVVMISKTNDPEGLIDNLKREVRDFKVTPENLEKAPVTSPFFNMAFIVAKDKGATDWFNGMKLHADLLGKSYELERHHIFPYNLLKEKGYYEDKDGQKIANEIANRAFLTKRANIKVSAASPKDYLVGVAQERPDSLKHQFVPVDRALWEPDAFEDFLKRRRQIISEEINDFLARLVSESRLEIEVRDLVKQEEGYNLEFKSSFLWNMKEQKSDKRMKLAVLKTVLSFMNSNGGLLLIGVDDDGQVVGPENDYLSTRKKNKDGFLLELGDYIQNTVGLANYSNYVSVGFKEIDEKEACLVQVEKSAKPCFFEKDGRKILYVRVDNKTLPLDDAEEINQFIQDNWA